METAAMGAGRDPIRIGVADAVRVHREALATALSACDPSLTVISSTSDAYETIFVAAVLHPVVVLVNLAPAEATLVFQRVPTTSATRCFVTFATGDIQTPLPQHAAAAVAYIGRNAAADDLAATVEWMAGFGTRPSAVLLVASGDDSPRPDSDALDLTRRELEILSLLEADLSNKEIAAHLFIELPTVKNHVHNILRKLHVSSRTDAVRHVRTCGLLGNGGISDGTARGLTLGHDAFGGV